MRYRPQGTLKIRIGDHTEILHEGDTILRQLDASRRDAIGGQDCIFYAIVINPPEGFVSNEAVAPAKQEIIAAPAAKKQETASRIWENYISPVEDENGQLLSISYKNEESFNFAYDVVDALAARNPDKLSMLHVDREKNERRFTFGEISRLSSARKLLPLLGIKRATACCWSGIGNSGSP